jgi:hypothetical protein
MNKLLKSGLFPVGAALRRDRSLHVKSRRKAAPTPTITILFIKR